MDSRSEVEIIYQRKLTKKKRAMYLNDRINQYNHLARTTKDVRMMWSGCTLEALAVGPNVTTMEMIKDGCIAVKCIMEKNNGTI